MLERRCQLFVRVQFGRPIRRRHVARDLRKEGKYLSLVMRKPREPGRAFPYSGSGQTSRPRFARITGARTYVLDEQWIFISSFGVEQTFENLALLHAHSKNGTALIYRKKVYRNSRTWKS